MEIIPVKAYRWPRYPDKRIVLDHPELLKTLPQRWKNNARAIAALSALIAMTTTGCIPQSETIDSNDTRSGINAGTTDPKGNSQNEGKRVNWIAPVFEHGDGRGAFGCESIAPPSFLSEEEAMDVIRAEAQKEGITLASEGLTLEGVQLPETKYYLNDGKRVDSSQKGDLHLDGYDSEKKIGVEFVSVRDYDTWHTDESIMTSISDYDFLSAAQIMQKGLNEKSDKNVIGVFYDPMPDFDEEKFFDEETDFDERVIMIREEGTYEKMAAMLKEEATESLRQQVVDFLEWLKGEGII